MAARTHEENVALLVDRAEITDLIGRYTYGMDSRDWEMYRSIWTDQIDLDFTEAGLFDSASTQMDADHWVASLAEFFKQMTASNHLKVPISFKFDGDRCTVLSTMRGKHFMPTDTGAPFHEVVGYYLDEFVRTEDGWKLQGLRELVAWNEGNAFVLHDNLRRLLPALFPGWQE